MSPQIVRKLCDNHRTQWEVWNNLSLNDLIVYDMRRNIVVVIVINFMKLWPSFPQVLFFHQLNDFLDIQYSSGIGQTATNTTISVDLRLATVAFILTIAEFLFGTCALFSISSIVFGSWILELRRKKKNEIFQCGTSGSIVWWEN